MRTITLELLRHGPPNNQLLSPLTPYLALCENHAPVTVNVPFEHNQFLHRLSALSYSHGEASRSFYIHDTAHVLGELLSEIPGLTAELSRTGEGSDQLTHLRLIVSSSELALLPFELALSPSGFPGAGQHLLLQSQTPLCITREVRRVPELPSDWPKRPKILLATASPPGFEEVPLAAHLLALRKAIDPWIPQNRMRDSIGDHIVVLPQATDLEIEDACATNEFTHIHILAHGVEYRDDYDVRFGLALHNTRNPDGKHAIVSGKRLATILRARNRSKIDDLARPSVVTLASCNSGNQGSVAGTGASVAHALHDSGIPIVIASQFPLSFEGSIRMVEVMYDGLLWGDDPRTLLSDLRLRLHSQFPDHHDWASLTAYASLPPTIEADLMQMKLDQADRSIKVAMSMADSVTRKYYANSLERMSKSKRAHRQTGAKEEAEVQKRIEIAKNKLHTLLKKPNANRTAIYGQLASTEKRQAEIVQGNPEESVRLLKRAASSYWEAFQADRANSWGVVQYLSLVVVLARLYDSQAARKEQLETELWILAHSISRQDLHSADQEKRYWAIGNLIELYLLSSTMSDWPGKPRQQDAEKRALEFAKQLLEIDGEESFPVYSTQRQMARYEIWYPKLAELGAVPQIATNLVNELPSTWEDTDG